MSLHFSASVLQLLGLFLLRSNFSWVIVIPSTGSVATTLQGGSNLAWEARDCSSSNTVLHRIQCKGCLWTRYRCSLSSLRQYGFRNSKEHEKLIGAELTSPDVLTANHDGRSFGETDTCVGFS